MGTFDFSTGLREQLQSELGRFREATALVKRRLPSSACGRELMISKFISLEANIQQKYNFHDEFDSFFGDQIPNDLELIALSFLPLAFEQVILESPSPSDLRLIFNDLCTHFNLILGDLSYYVRELDPLSKYKKAGLSQIDILRHEVARKITHAYVEYHLLIGDLERFQLNLIDYRRSLSPSMILQSLIRLHFGFKISAHPKLVSLVFGGRLESALMGNASTSIGHISLDKHLRQFFTESGLELTTDGLLSFLDDFFESTLSQVPSWLSTPLAGLCSGSSHQSYTGRLFNYNGWSDGVEAPAWSILRQLEIRYPEESYNNLIYQIAKTTNLNKSLRNFTREFLGIPKVGEGQWISELFVLHIVRQQVTCEVVHQWAPEWLKPQRLDIGIPSLNLAFEYNGKQHYEPVDFFGGEASFKRMKRLDAKKQRLCFKNGVQLVDLSYQLSKTQLEERIYQEIKRLSQ